MDQIREAVAAAVRGILFSAGSLTPADFSPLFLVLFGFYYLLAIAVCLVVMGIRRSLRQTIAVDLIAAILISLLLWPSLGSYPGPLAALPLATLFGGLDNPLVSLVSFGVGAAALFGLFRFRRKRISRSLRLK